MHATGGPGDPVAGVVLTGGSSRRMGTDKARLPFDGVPLAERVAHAVRAVCAVAIEVGPGVSGLSSVAEAPLHEGPLVAFVSGANELRRRGHNGAVLLVACDLPFIQPGGLAELIRWPVRGSVIPVVDGHKQPLCARWSARDIDTARSIVEAGDRSMRALINATHPTLVNVGVETAVLGADQLVDVDTPSQATRAARVVSSLREQSTWRSVRSER